MAHLTDVSPSPDLVLCCILQQALQFVTGNGGSNQSQKWAESPSAFSLKSSSALTSSGELDRLAVIGPDPGPATRRPSADAGSSSASRAAGHTRPPSASFFSAASSWHTTRTGALSSRSSEPYFSHRGLAAPNVLSDSSISTRYHSSPQGARQQDDSIGVDAPAIGQSGTGLPPGTYLASHPDELPQDLIKDILVAIWPPVCLSAIAGAVALPLACGVAHHA